MGYSSIDCRPIFLLLALVSTNAVVLFEQADDHEDEFLGIFTGETSLQVVEEEYNAETERRSIKNSIFVGSGSGYHSNEFTWRITSYSTVLSKSQVDDTVEQAFKMWSEAANIIFIRATGEETAIAISFVDGDLLGFHSFDIHTQGVNLLGCLAHEIGHAIGIVDSKKDSDVMFASYCQQVSDHKVTLSESDKAAARQLYGPATHSGGVTNDYAYTTSIGPSTHQEGMNEYRTPISKPTQGPATHSGGVTNDYAYTTSIGPSTHQEGMNEYRTPISKPTQDRSSLKVVFFFVGIFVGGFALFAGLVGYMKIKQKKIVDKKSMDKRKNIYMAYMTDTGNTNSAYEDLQYSRPNGTDQNPIYHDIKETVIDYLTPTGLRQDITEIENHYTTPIA